MNPFDTMLEVLRLLTEGHDARAMLQCSPCEGEQCVVCGGTGSVGLSSLYSDTSEWRVEAPLIVQGITPMGLRDPLLRSVVVPMVQAHRLILDEDRGKRRWQAAKDALARCAAEDWRTVCLNWIEQAEKGTL